MNKLFFYLECFIKALFTLFVVFGSQWVRADDIGLSVRAVGMGNAYTSVVNDLDAVFYNPAGYAKLSGFRWTILDPAIGLNNVDSYQELADLLSDTSDMAGLLNELYGRSITAYVGGNKTMFSLGSFTFGAYGLGDLNFQLNNPAFPVLETAYKVDYGLVVGWGMEFIPKIFSLGLQTRRITRQGGDIPIGVSTLANLDPDEIQEQLNRKGTGYAFDLGANLMLPNALGTTFSFVWRDVGDTKFKAAEVGDATPGSVEDEIILGVGMTWSSTFLDFRTAIDYRYLNRTGRQIGNNLGIGVEFDMPMIDIRAGLHQGYYTLGASFGLWVFRIDAATYGVELGAYPGQLEDRRYMVQFIFDFAIDPDFNFLSTSGGSRQNKKHGRKQRR